MDKRKNKRCSGCGARAPRTREDGGEVSLCLKCRKGLESTLNEHWFDKWIIKVEEELDPQQLAKWNTLDYEVKKAFILECIDAGIIKLIVKPI
tara:strand:- start:19298 stop:19576 length:279 start_codon:yes stop_codon:yes gene_type:complete